MFSMTFSVTLLVMVIMIAMAYTAGMCPKSTNSIVVQNTCFQFVQQKRNWEYAQKDCTNRGGRLAQIKDYYISRKIIYNAVVKFKFGNSFWIGIGRHTSGPTSFWQSIKDNCIVDMIATYFGIGQFKRSETGNCLRVGIHDYFIQTTCASSYYYICEIDIKHATTTTQPPSIMTTGKPLIEPDFGTKAKTNNDGLERGVIVGIVAILCFVVFAVAVIAVLVKMKRRSRKNDDWRMPIISQNQTTTRNDLSLMEVSSNDAVDKFDDESECYYNYIEIGNKVHHDSNNYKTFSGRSSSTGNRYSTTLLF